MTDLLAKILEMPELERHGFLAVVKRFMKNAQMPTNAASAETLALGKKITLWGSGLTETLNTDAYRESALGRLMSLILDDYIADDFSSEKVNPIEAKVCNDMLKGISEDVEVGNHPNFDAHHASRCAYFILALSQSSTPFTGSNEGEFWDNNDLLSQKIKLVESYVPLNILRAAQAKITSH